MFPEDLVASSPVSDAGASRPAKLPARSVYTSRFWLHAALLAVTLFTTCLVGSRMHQSFQGNLPLDINELWIAFFTGWRNPADLAAGLPFSLTLLTILLAHEMGHLLACMHYRIDASLPYFLPAPPFGTFGAFIRIRSPLYYRRMLFDVAVWGPLAGFVFLVPALAIGVAYSKVIPGFGGEGDFRFGVPPVLWLIEKAIFPGVSPADIHLHPVARAAWIGLLATGWNLIPVGQLDGGHILYSVSSARHRLVSWLALGSLAIMGMVWPGWFLWVLLLYFARRHPPIFDAEPLSPGRKKVAWLALAIFLLCFTPAPITENPGF